MLGSAYILPKVLTKNRKTFTVGNNITCILYFTHRIAAILYRLETCFVPYVLKYLVKCDNKYIHKYKVICLLTFPRRAATAPVVFMCEVLVVELWM